MSQPAKPIIHPKGENHDAFPSNPTINECNEKEYSICKVDNKLSIM